VTKRQVLVRYTTEQALSSVSRAILRFFMASRSDLCHHHLTLIY